jgi:protein-S-isoprenylcysteine O-methyltransferase Ste14
MRKAVGLLYGGLVYLFFFATFLYTIGFIGNVPGLKNIDHGNTTSPLWFAIVVDLLLLGLFALQHSVMARQAFKRRWTKIIAAPLERSTYVLAASAVLVLLIWQWRPIPEAVWTITNPAGWWLLTVVFWLSWGMLLWSTFLIDHFALFGLRQVYSNWRGQELPAPRFKTPALYQLVRHPIYLSFVLAFWSTPSMTVGRLLFASCATGYVLFGAFLEERDLVAQFGADYQTYQRQIPMLLPRAAFPGAREALTRVKLRGRL